MNMVLLIPVHITPRKIICLIVCIVIASIAEQPINQEHGMILIMIGWEKRKIVKRKQPVTDKNIWEIIVVDKILKMILKNEIVFEKLFLQPTCLICREHFSNTF